MAWLRRESTCSASASATRRANWPASCRATGGASPAPAGRMRAVPGIREAGHDAVLFDGETPMDSSVLDGVTHVLHSISPSANGDPVLRLHGDDLAARADQIAWFGYLSTTGVYGDRGGDWVDEASSLEPSTSRGQARLEAEAGWFGMREAFDLPVHVFRLAGIYGPGRNQIEGLRNGTAKRIFKPGQVFSRIHVRGYRRHPARLDGASQPGFCLQCLR
jgi:hypothetical protein